MPAEIGDGVARRVPGDARRQLRRVIMGVPDVLAPLDDAARAIVDQRRAAGAAARRIIVVEPRLIFDLARPSAHRHIGARQQRVGVMGAEFGFPRKLPREAVGAIDDVRDLSRQARNIERRAVDDFDPLDIARGNARKLGEHVVGLVRRPLAVEQDVARRLAQSAPILAVADRKARNLRQHVIGVLRRVAREIGGGEDLPRRAVRARGDGGRRRVAGRCRLLCEGGQGGKRGGERREAGGRFHWLLPRARFIASA